MPYTTEQFITTMSDISPERLKWDQNIERIEVICEIPPDLLITYTVSKKIPMISSRDMVLVSKIVKLQKGTLLINTSCEHPDFAPSQKFVRAAIHVSGYYLEPIEKDLNGHICKVMNITVANFGGKIPKAIIKTTTAKHLPTFVKKLHTEIQKRQSL